MSSAISALSSTLNAMQQTMQRMERDAQVVSQVPSLDASAAAATSSPVTAPEAGGVADGDTTGAMVDMLMAQRAFAAQLRVLRVADEMLQTAVGLPGSAGR